MVLAMALSGAAPAAAMRVLCLHGKGNCGASFRRRLLPAIDALEADGVEFTFADAPHAMEGKGEGEREWWTLPPGVRSFQAESYGGVDDAFEVLAGAEREAGPFDCLWGHSQGAMLAAIVLTEQLAGRGPLEQAPKGVIVNGAAWPAPYGGALEALQGSAVPSRALHVVGARDDTNPPEQGLRVAACLGVSAGDCDRAAGLLSEPLADGACAAVGLSGSGQVLVHGGAHVVPLDRAALDEYRRFFLSLRG